jgi:hypothetical protein
MRRSTILALTLLVICQVSQRAFAQQNRIVTVGVVTMQTLTGKNAPTYLGRDRLVDILNQQKPDKKRHLKVQAMPLDLTTPNDVEAEAKQKNCDYVVYTRLVALEDSSGSVISRPGTLRSDPGGIFGPLDTRQAIVRHNIEIVATVQYKLYRTGDPVAISSAPVSNREVIPTDVVEHLLDQVANRVFLAIKKATPPPQP